MAYYPIAPLQQPDNMSCWITSLTILKRWSTNNNALAIDDVLATLGDPYPVYFQTQAGLPGGDTPDFCNKAGLLFDAPQNYSAQQWSDNLTQRGPLWVDVLVYIDPIKNIAFTHVKILVGVTVDPVTELNSTFIFIDPAVGEETTQIFQQFLAIYEAIPSNQIDTIQVCYSQTGPPGFQGN